MSQQPLIAESQLARLVLKMESHTSSALPQAARRQCGVVSAIKDEAAYIHEFIHHHLFFGFAEIVLLVNRTTDSTVHILNKICSTYPQVSFLVTDFIDDLGLASSIQRLSFAYGIRELRRHRRCGFALVVDADEFWTPLDFKTPIADALAQYPDFDLLSLNWAPQHIDEEPFSPPFSNLKAMAGKSYKSIVNLASPIITVKPHFAIMEPSYSEGQVWLDSFGVEKLYSIPLFGEKSRYEQAYESDRPRPWWHRLLNQNSYILHRVQRSESEYLFNLLRGRAELNEFGKYLIKTYKNGFSRKTNMPLQLDPSRVAQYHESLHRFVIECGIAEEVGQARDKILSVVSHFGEILPLALDHIPALERQSVLAKVLSGTRFSSWTLVDS